MPAFIVYSLLASYVVFRSLSLLFAKSDYSLYERLLYAPVYAFARVMWRVRVEGGRKLADKRTGGAIIVANHRCSLDPFFVQLAAGRRVHWMVAAEYFRHPLFGAVLRIFQAIPTTRSGSDNAATKLAVRLASDGRLVGMFPEGRLNRTNNFLISMRPGAILVADRAKVPIVPMWIQGAPIGDEVWKPVLMPAAVRIRVGKPTSTAEMPDFISRKEQSDWLASIMLSARNNKDTNLTS